MVIRTNYAAVYGAKRGAREREYGSILYYFRKVAIADYVNSSFLDFSL